MSQYIYLLQEREFIKTKENVYKVGMTKKENHERFNQYPKGSILLFQVICNNCKNMEKVVVKNFKESFIQRKDYGNEYFEGDYKRMIDIIYLTIKNENDECMVEETLEEEVEELEELEEVEEVEELKENKFLKKYVQLVKSKKYQEDAYKKVCKNIHNVFPDYMNDIAFGGIQKFIKIAFNTDENYVIYYINPQVKSLIYSEDGDVCIGKDYYDNFTEYQLMYVLDYNIICEDMIKFIWEEEKEYFDMLVREKIIVPNTIYDLYSKRFIKKLLTTKMQINIDNYNEFITTHNITIDDTIYNKIYTTLSYNLVINGKIYASIENDIFKKIKKVKDFENITVDIGMIANSVYKGSKLITLYKINKKYYDYQSFLRKYTPYVIRWDDDNNYYIVNRDYEYIGLNSKSIDDKRKESQYLFNDGNTPWDNRNDYIRYCNEYKKCINKLNHCLNSHNLTRSILTLLD